MVCPAFPVQRLQERYQIGLLAGCQMQSLDIGVEVLVRLSALVIELDYFFQGVQAPIVHVRRGLRDVSQGGSLKAPQSRGSLVTA